MIYKQTKTTHNVTKPLDIGDYVTIRIGVGLFDKLCVNCEVIGFTGNVVNAIIQNESFNQRGLSLVIIDTDCIEILNLRNRTRNYHNVPTYDLFANINGGILPIHTNATSSDNQFSYIINTETTTKDEIAEGMSSVLNGVTFTVVSVLPNQEYVFRKECGNFSRHIIVNEIRHKELIQQLGYIIV